MGATYILNPMLPWTPVPEEDGRYRRILGVTMALSLALAIGLPFVPIKPPERLAVPEIPQRFAKLVMERKQPPPPPPPPPKVEQPKPELPKPETVKPEAKPEPKPKPAPLPQERAAARERAQKTGVLAFRDSLAGLREEAPVDKLARQPLNTGGSQAKAADRNLLTGKAGKGSGGIDTARLSRETGGSGELAGRTTTTVTGPAGLPAAEPERAAGKPAHRSDQEIQLVFDQNKSALYSLYNRALRSNPALKGKMVLKLTIAPSGEVTAVEIVSSELGDADLERKIQLRVKRFEFGARKGAGTMTIRLPIEFLPS